MSDVNKAGVPQLSSTPVRVFTRRLSDKLFIAFDQACDTGELSVAQELLVILEGIFSRPSPHPKQDRRKNMESLVEAHERLWDLKRRQENRAPELADG